MAVRRARGQVIAFIERHSNCWLFAILVRQPRRSRNDENRSAERSSRWAKRRLQTLRDGREDFNERKSARRLACSNRSFQRQPLKTLKIST
jgi:GT2 family glycosyltransferase